MDDETRSEAEAAAFDERRKRHLVARDYFKAALQCSPVVVSSQDKDLRYTFIANPPAGFDEGVALGRTDFELMECPDDAQKVGRLKRCVLESGRAARQEIGMTIAGERRWYDIHVHPQHDGDEVIGVLCTAVNVTDRHQVEEELRQASANAERANRAKSRFLAAASHDLRQPLAALTLYTDALKARVMHVDRPLVESMRECLGSLNSLLTDLLDLSKLEAGVVKPNATDFSITELLDGLIQAHSPEAKVKGVRLRLVPSRVTVISDKVLLRRIVGNFVANAIRYTAKGSVLVGCRRRADKLWIEVWDTGIGIPEDKLDAIFEEFRQLDEARPRGSGLGLAIAARTASLLKAQIKVKSRLGKGSVFSVAVPIGSRTREQPSPKPSVDLMLRLALIEDNDHVREALTLALAANGHKVVAAATTREIRKRLGKRAPDVVIADYRLAGQETGIAAIGQLRAMFGQELPAVLITGDTDPHLLRSMSDHGIVVQHKPIRIDVLQACITGLVRGRPEGRQVLINLVDDVAR